jgi:hypothetical protein
MGQQKVNRLDFAYRESGSQMNRVQRSDDRREGLACALQNRLVKRMDARGFVHNPDVSYEIGYSAIGKIAGKSQPVDIP